MMDDRRRREEATRGESGWSPVALALSVLLHALAIGLIFLAPHKIPSAPPTAYTVEIVDPSALGGKLLAGPIGGPLRQPPPPKPPPAPEPPPQPPPPEPKPPEQVAKVEEPAPPEPDDEEADAVPLGTPRATPIVTVTRRIDATARMTVPPTLRPTAQPTARPTARSTSTIVAPAKPKTTATPIAVIAKKPVPSPEPPSRRADNAPATLASETRPKTPTAAQADLDGQLAAAIKGVEAKVEKAEGRGVGGAAGAGGGMGGTERKLDGPAGIGGDGPGGGGTVRGLEFVIYYNQMLNRIKERWAWVGTRGDLRVTVRFSILPSGEIMNIRLVERSGDQSYDASVERAVKGAGPLAPPPEAYRNDFADVELTFRPADLQRPPG